MGKKRKNWLEKFQDFWWDELTALQRKCLWDVLTATRGPDREPRNGDRIKWATTARIRYFLLGREPTECHYGFISDKRELPITQKTIQKSVGYHFIDHVRSTVRRLGDVVKKSEMKDLLKIFNMEEE